jgi:hypothetical protein
MSKHDAGCLLDSGMHPRNADVEWKFSKSLFFLEYNTDVMLFPVPFNLLDVVGWKKLFTSGCSRLVSQSSTMVMDRGVGVKGV